MCEGTLIGKPRGEGGFGYDPIFVPAGWDETMAELSAEQKDRISHRGRAFRALREALEAPPELGLTPGIGRIEGRISAKYLTQGRRPTRRLIMLWSATTEAGAAPRPVRKKRQSTEGFFDGKSPGVVYAVGLTFTVVLLVLDFLSGAADLVLALLPDAARPGDVEPRAPGRDRDGADLHRRHLVRGPRGPGSDADLVPYWNAIGRFAVFIAFAVLLATLRDDARRRSASGSSASTRCRAGCAR